MKQALGVMLLALRPVAWAAKQIGSLQQVSGNRLILGVGTGNPAHGDRAWRAAGVSFTDRGARTDEALRLLPSLVGGEPTTLGDDLSVTLSPGAPMPPVMIAGNGRRALRRAADFGDSWAAMAITPAEVTEGLAKLTGLAAERNRPRPGVTVVGPPLDTTDPSRAADQLAAYADAGTDRVVLAPTGPDWRRDYEFAAAVRAAIRA
ncbi:LLM class flavin-dependent oxidoreductase [Actinoplanes bogorensis]|uniref:LLM class flavin-dependent oxidoreductase n=1 Tax=Paractinoplanes bogorensis TaxID=1610840 RepID=A0ABS5YWP9_9ACTN|nr:LLM class flavin-dependent oxidoreductase [Actinoplanes bogorensis]MBU2667874.1 LLM class flavin-dependent oxidoreductase [Actinoplanes bogorensis]